MAVAASTTAVLAAAVSSGFSGLGAQGRRRRAAPHARSLAPSPLGLSRAAPSSAGSRGRLRCDAALMPAVVLAKYAVSGGVGCCISHSGAVPLDVIKTRVQTNPERFQGQGMLATGQTLVAEEGPGVLLQGLGSTLVAGPYTAVPHCVPVTLPSSSSCSVHSFPNCLLLVHLYTCRILLPASVSGYTVHREQTVGT